MDRISALRNVEAALREFEEGDADLAATQDRVRAVLQTYATEFEADERRPYRVTGADEGDGRVVVAPDPATARERIADDLDGDPDLSVDPLSGDDGP